MLQSLHFHLRAMENERRLYTRKREKYLGPRHGMYVLAGLFCYGICYLNAGSCCHDLHFYFLFVYDTCLLSHLSSHPILIIDVSQGPAKISLPHLANFKRYH